MFPPITPIVSNLFESAVKEQLVDYCQTNDIISPKQSAYIRNCSTQTALHTIINDLAINIDEGKINTVCSLDIAKGFDTISPSVLLHKMRFYGFNGHSLTWFKSYLSGPTQIFKSNSKLATILPVHIGVPQGRF